MEKLLESLIERIKNSLEEKFSQFDFSKNNFSLEPTPNSEMGDFGFPCFPLAKIVKKSPQEIAEILAQEIRADEIVEKTKAVGGYLNVFLKKDYFSEKVLKEILKEQDNFGRNKKGGKKKILIDFSSPNTNKPQHLGHLRNNILGESISNILENQGFKIIKTNLISDRGIHICKSMLAYQKWGKGETPKSSGLKGDYLVGKYYVLFSEKSKENPKLLEEVQELLRKWEAGDKETINLWQKMNNWVYQGFKETYKKLGITFDRWDYESKNYKSGKKIVLDALKKGKCYKRQDGAVEIDLTKYNLDKKVLIRSDGTTIYIIPDIGVAKLRYKEEKFDQCLYVTGFEQEYHFKVLFKILELFGFKWVDKLFHIPYGLVSLPSGKMKSREGKVVETDELIIEVEELAKKEILKRELELPQAELKKRTDKIALASLKFFFLKFTSKQEICFDPQKEVSFEGDTGPYIQYAYARIESILRKSALKNQPSKIRAFNLQTDEEWALIKLLFQYPQILEQSSLNYNPAGVCLYLLQLASLFNKFYQKTPVLKAEKEEIKKARLILIQSIAIVLKNGLNILGIETLEKM